MYKTFNGKRYRVYAWHFDKSSAKEQAKQMRKIGWLARVVTIPVKMYGKQDTRYEVYVCKNTGGK